MSPPRVPFPVTRWLVAASSGDILHLYSQKTAKSGFFYIRVSADALSLSYNSVLNSLLDFLCAPHPVISPSFRCWLARLLTLRSPPPPPPLPPPPLPFADWPVTALRLSSATRRCWPAGSSGASSTGRSASTCAGTTASCRPAAGACRHASNRYAGGRALRVHPCLNPQKNVYAKPHQDGKGSVAPRRLP